MFANPAAADEGAAWRALALRWDLTLPAGDPCAVAPALSLQCYSSRAGLAPIRQLDRPGLLKLVDGRGRVAWALLTALGPDRATLEVDGAAVELPLARLAQAWRGEFATFWRAPPGYLEGQLPDARGTLGRWLAAHLPAAEGALAASGSDDAALQARVAAFQLAHGLLPDGLAGPLTLMQVNRGSGIDEPRLVTLR